jgi:hypothetical protein
MHLLVMFEEGCGVLRLVVDDDEFGGHGKLLEAFFRSAT